MQKSKDLKKPTLPVVNAGPPDTEYLYYPLVGCHPKGLIVVSSYNIKQTVIIITIRICTNITFIYQFQFSFQSNKENRKYVGVVHLRISFWYLLMKLKNNYLLKQLLKWAKKKQNNFNIYNVAFFKKIKKNTRIYHYFTSVYQKSQWYDLQFLRCRA